MHAYRFFACDTRPVRPLTGGGLQPSYCLQLWRPSLASIRPAGVPLFPFVVWWLFHQLRVFSNGDYAILCVRDGDALVHRSCVFPRYFRFPFMAQDDLQVGDTWTDPAHRGRGLATTALQRIIDLLGRDGRRFWYLVEDSNVPSIRAVEKAGFVAAGAGRRTARWGVKLLGAYVMDDART